MNPWRWVDPRVSQLKLDHVRAYLERHGYVETAEPNPNLLRFESSGNGRAGSSFVLPASEKLADFAQSITYFLTILSEVENRHPDPLLEEMPQQSEHFVGRK